MFWEPLRRLLFLCAVCLPLCGYSAETTDSDRSVLILHSYHSGFGWSNFVNSGMLSVLNRYENLDCFIEYLDSRQNRSYPNQPEILKDYLQKKYSGRTFDVVMCSDDYASTFALENRAELFPDVPLVFCGVPLSFLDRIQPRDNLTGVVEEPNVIRTVEIALQLFPQTKSVHVVRNDTENDIKHFETVEKLLVGRYELHDHIKNSTERVLALLAERTESDTVLFLSAPKDWLEVMEQDDRAVRACRAPIFTSWDSFMGHGMLGGLSVSGINQGKTAAQLVLRIMAGEDPDAIPFVVDGPNEYVFDARQMKKWGLQESDFPAGSRFINRPESVVAKYLPWLVWGGLVTVAQTGLLVYLFYTLSRRNKAEKSLRASEERLSLALNAANEGLWDFCPGERSVIYYSPKWYTLLGYEPYELPSTYETFCYLLHPDDLPKAEKAIWETATRGGRNFGVEFRMRTKDGKYRWILSRGRVVEWGPDNSPRRMVGTHVDITEQREMEERLRQSQKMESVGLLAGGIAHDFNNLLTTVIGYCDLTLSRLETGSPLYHPIHEIRRAGDRATLLTRQLLAFSRKQILEPKVIQLNDLVRNMDSMMRRLIGEDIELVNALSVPLDFVLADAGQIEQVLMNLVVNARDAMPHGGKIVIETRNVILGEEYALADAETTPGPYVMLAVSDTGCGIEPENLKRIFDPFFTTKGRGKGTGLGLSMVYGIVKQSGGHVSVYSEPGRGTALKIYLPRTSVPSPEKTEEKTVLPPVVNGRETILVVEDEEAVRRLVKGILETHGYVVIDFGDGADAAGYCERMYAPCDLLLTDVVLPKTSGRLLAERLTARHPEIKVLYMSGYTDTAIVQHGLLEQGIHFLHKPFSPESLLLKIRGILDER